MTPSDPELTPYPNIAIVGSTASGKTGLSYSLGELLPCSYVCCDSVQMYKGFDIGSAKPTAEERQRHPHYLFDTLEPDASYDAKAFRQDGLAAIAAIRQQQRVPVVVGGTGLYLRALMNRDWHDDLPSCQATRAALAELTSAELYARLTTEDPARAAQLHPNDRLRVIRALEIRVLSGQKASDLYGSAASPAADQPPWWIIHLDPPRETVLANIEQRTAMLLGAGLVAEVEGLLARYDAGIKPLASIGYKQVAAMLQQCSAEELDLPRLSEQITIATRQYAKRQRTWFRGIEADITTKLSSAAITSELAAELRDRFPDF